MSASTYRSSSLVGGNGCRRVRFEYVNCFCRQRACLKIVADDRRDSYGMLYFVCEKKGKVGGCKFFSWCYPKSSGYGQIRGEDIDEEIESQRHQGGERDFMEVGDRHRGRDFFVVIVACCSLVVAIVAMFITLFK